MAFPALQTIEADVTMLAHATPFDANKHPRALHGRFAAAAPTPAQAEAGNYKMGHVRIGGLDVSIENQAGSIRSKTNKIGQTWSVRMPAHYGYIKGTMGADGDHVDTYVGPAVHDAHNLPVHVVDQVHAHNGAFDEHKTLMGFPSKVDALSAYDAAFTDGSGPARRGAVHTMSFPDFKNWLRTGDTTKPISADLRAATPKETSPPSFSQKPLAETGIQRRSLTRGEAWQRNGPLYAPAANEIPVGYTGSRTKEHQEGTMLVHSFTPQIPKGMKVEDWGKLMRRLGGVANDGMRPAIEKATTEGIMVNTHKMTGPRRIAWHPPEGTTHGSLTRAYVHAAKVALHDYGVAKYDFAMDQHMKDELTPLVPFMRYAHRKMKNDMYVAAPGQWRQFRSEFGVPFETPKFDKFTGQERKRMRVNQELIKQAA